MKKLRHYLFAILILTLIVVSVALASGAVKLFDTSGVARGLKLAPDGSQDINLQDQTTRPALLRFSLIDDLTPTLAEAPTIDTYTITLEAGHSVTAGESLSIIYAEETPEAHPHYMTAEVLNVATNVLTLDEPVPYAFPVSSIVYTSTQAMNVDGSSTTKVFSLTNAFAQPADITKIIFHITDDAAMDDAKFGGISELTRGIVLRKKLADGHYENIFNAKSNGELGTLSGPIGKEYDDKAPAGVYGVTFQIDFAGQGNIGVAIRLLTGESIQLLIQDDIDALSSFHGMVKGHFTD